MIQRSVGFILTSFVMYVAGWQSVWHRDKIEELGGIGALISAVLFIGLGVLAIFWPNGWTTNGRRFITAGALFAFLFGGEFIRNSFLEAPVWTIVWIAAILIGWTILWAVTIIEFGRGWRARLRAQMARRRMRPAGP